MNRFLVLPVLLLLALRSPMEAATVEGRVALPEAGAAVATKPRYPIAASYEVGEPDPPAAIVALEGKATASPGAEVELAQESYQFAPGLLAVARGTTVRFPNHDDEYHSVFSYSKAKRFDLGRYHKDEAPVAVTFDQPGVVKLYCEIHDHMRGTIVVLDTPYFAKTDREGNFRIEGVEPGEYRMTVWGEDGDAREQTLVVPASGKVRADVAAR